MSNGRSVRLFLADGTPGGLLTAEIMNWTGHVIAAPRSDLGALLKREEASRTGIYLLLGDDPQTPGSLRAYIGEGDDVGKRLYQHARPETQGGKDFWSRAVIITSKDANLTKAHARYLESRFILLAKIARRAQLDNGTAPPLLALPEADVSDMEYFVEQAQIVLPVLGINVLRVPSAPTITLAVTGSGAAPSVSPTFELRSQKDKIVATAHEVDGEFVVMAGSQGRSAWTGVPGGYEALRQRLETDGTLAAGQGFGLHFTRDHVFASVRAAAAVVVGRSANGRAMWKTSAGISYGEWQDQQLQAAATSP